MNNTPKCPYCGDRMKIHILLHTTEPKFFSAWYQCVSCKSTSPRFKFPISCATSEIKKATLEVALYRIEPKNRVLTLEEVRNTEKDAFDFMMHWLELKFEPHKCKGEETASAIFAVSMYFDDESDDVIYSPAYVTDYYLLKNQYGKKWRCWLRKPTEAERRETPWAGDSHE